MAISPDSLIGRLTHATVRGGELVWIGVRPGRREAVRPISSALFIAGGGIEGDHYASPDGRRQVTLIAAEDLVAISSFLGEAEVAPERLRRNLVTSGINLVALKGRRFRVGRVLLEGTGDCAPCSRLEEEFGSGGYNAVRGHGGLTALVLEGGEVHVGDRILPIA
ncbi:MAG: MOSC domain-containing protein [Afipia sp.]|uniref:MOSC domain-containing protein n=2 Tax=Bacteria TaxID=2 RepID=UPI003CE6806D